LPVTTYIGTSNRCSRPRNFTPSLIAAAIAAGLGASTDGRQPTIGDKLVTVEHKPPPCRDQTSFGREINQ
jgi:hypothetical protein